MSWVKDDGPGFVSLEVVPPAKVEGGEIRRICAGKWLMSKRGTLLLLAALLDDSPMLVLMFWNIRRNPNL